ncbi:MAG TPA: sulfotransferase [Desulfobacteraceae bacterium]|nr:sulfotransferase [Desulfobacteraceae bacterium]HPJ67542.1 sulfotransferase [Desulfobacteraceae bacterium]HPQ28493.1 sulfotransferase [Desulfobacteraceae bacterium]
MKQIVFLTYLNRSGSTFLSRMLDEYADIGVTLEASFPDGIIFKSFNIKSQNDLETYLDRLFKDSKFNGWNLSREDLKAKLLELTYPATFPDIFPIILDEYFKKSNATTYIFKSAYINNIDKVKDLFPHAKIILLLRNPLAVFSSQKATKDTRTRKYMSACPIKFAISCRTALALSLRHGNKDWFYKLKYEDLIANPEKEMNKILAFLNVSDNKTSTNMSYFDKLPSNQKAIHKNITSDPISEKASTWRMNLYNEEIWIIQTLLSKYIYSLGYDLYEIKKIEFSERRRVLWYWIKFIFQPKGKLTMLKLYLRILKIHSEKNL